jgi:hypothetical protein
MIDRKYIIEITQQIVDKSFTSSLERKLFQHENRINLRCPYCLEGRTKSKKRGNIYFDKLIYVCFRCGKKSNFDRFTKDFGLRLDPEKKLEIIEHLDSNISLREVEEDLIETKLDKLIDFSDLDKLFNSGDVVITDFKPIKKNSEIYNYLIDRSITEDLQKNIFQARYWKNDERSEPVIVYLNRKNDKIIGCQIRNLKEGKGRFFKIYNYETLYKWINQVEEITDVDINELVIYNKLSYYFNILNVSFEDTITIFEGYLDSLFYPNSIGVVGVNTDMKFIENNQLSIQYFYDNDTAGNQKSEQKIKQGYSVFLWNKLFENIVKQKATKDPYSLMHRISKVKDLNKLAQLSKDPFNKFKLYEFFSKDLMDLKWIPKRVKKFNPINYRTL